MWSVLFGHKQFGCQSSPSVGSPPSFTFFLVDMAHLYQAVLMCYCKKRMYCCGRNKPTKRSVESSAMLPKPRCWLTFGAWPLDVSTGCSNDTQPSLPFVQNRCTGLRLSAEGFRLSPKRLNINIIDVNWLWLWLKAVRLWGSRTVFQSFGAASDLNASHSKGAKVKAWCLVCLLYLLCLVYFSVMGQLGGCLVHLSLFKKSMCFGPSKPVQP